MRTRINADASGNLVVVFPTDIGLAQLVNTDLVIGLREAIQRLANLAAGADDVEILFYRIQIALQG